MTTIISRLYPSADAANAVMAELVSRGHNEHNITLIGAGGADAMKAARLAPNAIAAYSKAMTSGQTLLVASIGFSPIGAARDAMRVVAKHESLDVGLADEDRYIRESDDIARASAIMASHPLLLTNPFRKASHGHILSSKPVSKGRISKSAIKGGAYMSKMFWPMKLVSKHKTKRSVISGGRLYSSLFGLPLLTGRM